MKKFQLGDKVLVLRDFPSGSCWERGHVGVVTELGDNGKDARLDDTLGGWIDATIGEDAELVESASESSDHNQDTVIDDAAEYTGGSVNYYRVTIDRPTSPDVAPHEAECNDIIEALGMNYAEGNAFKAIWRSCAARQGKAKRGYDNGLYDAEKVVFFGQRMVAQAKGEK